VTVATRADLDALRAVGRLVGEALLRMSEAVRPGTTTAAIDAVGAAFLGDHGARSGPQRDYGFPGFNCISVNDELVHGIPGPRAIRPGDVVKIDVTAELDGYLADAAVSVPVPPVADETRRLIDCAESAFLAALDVARAGAPIAAIGRAVRTETERRGFHVVRELTGHGVGRRVHELPEVPNHEADAPPGLLHEGLVIAVEPILTAVRAGVREDPDRWTLRTDNGCLGVHYEHTLVIRQGAPIILTGGPARASI
jgi:methionyl aminopeptidase